VRPSPVLRRVAATLALLACAACPAAAQERSSSARLWIEAGPSFDRDRQRYNNENGYALAGGIDLGRTLALMVGAAAEHYPLAGESHQVTIAGVGGPDTLRLEGGGNKRVLCVMAGLRLTIPQERLQPVFEVGVGAASVAADRPRYVDPSTGAVVYPSGRSEWSGALGELGLGIRTHRQKLYDWSLGVRWRTYTQLFEGSSGGSFQARVGMVRNL
jgi:hypothetical protein